MDILSTILQILLALMFLIAGFGKVFGSSSSVESFNHLKLPQWFRVITGLVELIGVASLIIGFWEASWIPAGGLLLGVVAIGGIIAHIRVKDSFKQTFTILLLGIIGFVLLWINYSDLSNFPGFK
ncbi:DoxX family protein [Gottfriedia sp. NPDC056225]|uniref:DoxX family protein n=1 Tax=Gottfriedia sp. NPDC056225 TaxID=3345751 RepID=UPI0015593CA8|nr:DoxX family protein [Arthrobacter citreus]